MNAEDIRNRIARGVEEHLLTVQNMTGNWAYADNDFIAEAQVAVQVAFACGVLTTSDDDIHEFLVECGFTPKWVESFAGDDGAIY